MSKPTVAIIGASTDHQKYGNKSVRAHLSQGYEVYPIHPSANEIEGLTAYPSLQDVPAENLDRISVYVPPSVGIQLLGAAVLCDESGAHRSRQRHRQRSRRRPHLSLVPPPV